MVALEKDDRFPAAGLESRVDALGFDANLLQKLLVTGDVGAAGRADLDKAETLEIGGGNFEKTFDAPGALENAFCVGHAGDTHAQESGFGAKLFSERGAPL